MKKINALIIDDEISAIITLRGMLERFFPKVNILEEARSVNDALYKLQRNQPDLVFLDIEMPPFGTGFEFLEKCQNLNFGVIFVTAYHNYAVQAINQVQPWGYLMKPYSVADLAGAIKIATAKLEQMDLEQKANPMLQSIVISDARKGNVIIRVGDIAYCQADGAATNIYFLKADKITRFTASKTLKDIEELLPDAIFSRSHHSYLVNLAFIERYVHTGRNGIIHLRTGAEVAISVGKMEAFEAHFNQFLRNTGQ